MTPAKKPRKSNYKFNSASILEIRKKLGLTQAQLSVKLCIPKITISRWETEVSIPNAEDLASVYSLALEAGIKPSFFIRSETKQGRSRLVVSWDFETLSSSVHNVTRTGEWIREELSNRFPATTQRLYKVFTGPLQSWRVKDLQTTGWRIQEFYNDIDDELYDQSYSDCGHDPQDTIFVLVSSGGDFVDLINDLRTKGVRVFLISPAPSPLPILFPPQGTSEQLIDAVGEKRRIELPSN
jgi:transcriptional regulator with XRE-family HTH domain